MIVFCKIKNVSHYPNPYLKSIKIGITARQIIREMPNSIVGKVLSIIDSGLCSSLVAN